MVVEVGGEGDEMLGGGPIPISMVWCNLLTIAKSTRKRMTYDFPGYKRRKREAHASIGLGWDGESINIS